MYEIGIEKTATKFLKRAQIPMNPTEFKNWVSDSYTPCVVLGKTNY